MCASRMLRRSGIACGLVCDVLGWKADAIFQVGVGQNHKETDVLSEEWPGVLWFGCEPHPIIYRQLCEEDYPGALYNVAIGDHREVITMYSPRRHKDGSSAFRPDGECEAFLMEMMTLDGYLLDTMNSLKASRNSRILLWLDCEGSELSALRGGECFIQGVQVVNVEMTAHPPGPGRPRPLEVHRWLADHGFFLQWLHTQRVHQGEIDAVYVRGELFKPDYCCIPHEVERYENGT